MYIFGAMSTQVFCSLKKLGCLIFLLSCNNVLVCISNRHLQHQVQKHLVLGCVSLMRGRCFPCISDPSLGYSQLGDFCGCGQPRSHCYCFKICIYFFSCIGSQLRHVGSLMQHASSGTLWHVGSQFPEQGSNLHPLHWTILNCWTTREVPIATVSHISTLCLPGYHILQNKTTHTQTSIIRSFCDITGQQCNLLHSVMGWFIKCFNLGMSQFFTA